VIERKYHALVYKRRYCRERVTGARCEYGVMCSAAHSDHELRAIPLHLLPVGLDFLLFRFKSQFCPFAWHRHNAFACVYAHNWQDFKRPYF